MDLNKLYEKQAVLDKHILDKHNIKMSKEELLDNTILALLVEIGELANTTRCFKHWSTKGMMDKEIVLDELADVWHFYLSIGNQVGFKKEDMFVYHSTKALRDDKMATLAIEFTRLLTTGGMIGMDLEWYSTYGFRLECLAELLGFTNEEVEQAYLKKHEENYKRQREGY